MLEKLRTNDVLAVPSDTGSGKSTLLPMLLVAEYGSCIVTQPRIAPCKRTKQFVGSKFGSRLVGCAWSGHECTDPSVRLTYVTDGLLAMRVHGGVTGAGGEVVFVDEVHERSKNIDSVLLGLAKGLCEGKSVPGFRGPKVVIASATLDHSVLAPFLHNGLTVSVEQVKVPSPFPVKQVKDFVGQHYLSATVSIFRDNRKAADEQVLCFLPGADQVRKAAEAFRELTGTAAETLYAQMPVPQIEAAVGRGVVFFSTNIAETSFTFPNMCHIVDNGKSNVPTSSTDGVVQLWEQFAPRSTCTQRKGRCGRTRPGCYYPLYADSELTQEFATPEVVRLSMLEDEFQMWVLHGQGMSDAKLSRFHPAGALPEFGVLASAANEQLQQMGVVERTGKELTDVGLKMKLLPEVGGVRMRVVAVKAIEHGVGEEIMELCATLMALQNDKGRVLTAIPPKYRDSMNGDVSSLLRLFRALAAQERQGSLPVFLGQFDLRLRPVLEKMLQKHSQLPGNLKKELARSSGECGVCWG
eukprot:TRINITY_DN4163_c0_g1_i2.p1 TRINITY_DN4163_c0_g1~~TRINITY_DN4163_c0_g1_i2.p1  ORF type:complete len:524 (+),score=148.85 TRINITY_DN4163_c0_g1_i2:202-1773(+)